MQNVQTVVILGSGFHSNVPLHASENSFPDILRLDGSRCLIS
jgi:hypothetical protein